MLDRNSLNLAKLQARLVNFQARSIDLFQPLELPLDCHKLFSSLLFIRDSYVDAICSGDRPVIRPKDFVRRVV